MLARAALLLVAASLGCRPGDLPLVPASFESELPVVAIEAGSVIGDEPKTPARVRVYEQGELTFESAIGIELRGRSSQVLFPKRQFGLELRTAGDIQTEAPLLGMPSESDWVLLGPYSDKSFLRDALTFELARQMGQTAPRSVFVELFLRQGAPRPSKEEYQGLYLAAERISRGAGRVNLPRSRRLPGEDSGFIAKLDWLDPDRREAHFTTTGGERVILIYPSAKDATEEQIRYLNRYLEDFEESLVEGDYADLIDVGSFVDGMILQELAKNVDAYRSSTYFHKFPGGKVRLGPVWDFNQAYGNASYNQRAVEIEGWRAARARPGSWFRRLFGDELFFARFQNRYRELRGGPLGDQAIFGFLDREAARLEEAAARNFERWPVLGEIVLGNPDPPPNSYEGEVALLKEWLQARTRFMDEAAGALP
jgi:CotH kinase protein